MGRAEPAAVSYPDALSVYSVIEPPLLPACDGTAAPACLQLLSHQNFAFQNISYLLKSGEPVSVVCNQVPCLV